MKKSPHLMAAVIIAIVASFANFDSAEAQQIDIVGQAGSGSFGNFVFTLPNGNFVVQDPDFDGPGGVLDVGAVYLFDGASLSIVSTLTGTSLNDHVGSAGIMVLSDGNFLVRSPLWDNGSATDAGALTWCSKTTGCGGPVSSGNSLVGSTTDDNVGGRSFELEPPIQLANGKYVVSTRRWDNPANGMTNVGAITLCDSSAGCRGVITPDNSLIGSSSGDELSGVTALTNGNYVASSVGWDGPGGAVDLGIAKLCSGTVGCVGTISSVNAITGTTAGDKVGGSFALTNGNYVLVTPYWDNSVSGVVDVGAATLCNGQTGCTGTISAANSLVGSTAGDSVGGTSNFGKPVTALSNGNYVVTSTGWHNASGNAAPAGAVTFCSGVLGCTGAVAASNSLVGTTAGDQLGDGAGVFALASGNYVVGSARWSNPSSNTSGSGAVTFCSGTSGCIGPVTTSNSLVGNSTGDAVGLELAVLADGNYVVGSQFWNNTADGIADAGAATWCSGTDGCLGTINASNSLIGTRNGDRVGEKIYPLTNANYVVASPFWDTPNGTVNVGAATWCPSNSGCTGTISVSNSLIGGTADDRLAWFNQEIGVIALSNGNYVVRSSQWDNPQSRATDAGEVTFCKGGTGCSGTVDSFNSLVGTSSGESVGNYVWPFDNGDYRVVTTAVDNGSAVYGAVTYGNGRVGTLGTINPENSVLFNPPPNLDSLFRGEFDPLQNHLIVGRPAENTVTILTPNVVNDPSFTFVESPGNGNGFPEPGEQLTLTISLRNISKNTATGTSLQMVGGDTVDYGTIAEGQTVTRQVRYTVPLNAQCGTFIDLRFNVNSSLGTISITRTLLIGQAVATFSEDFDQLAAPAIPAGWSAVSIQNGMNFVTATFSPDAGANSAFAQDPTSVGGGTDLTSPVYPISSQAAILSFRNRFSTESGWDGGVLEIKIGNGPFQDIIAAGGIFLEGGYNGMLGPNGVNNPISGRRAWTGVSNGYFTTRVQLPAIAAGQNVQFRFRFGADDNTVGPGSNPGWYVDTLKVFGSYSCSNTNRSAPFDFDADGKTDIGIFRPGANAEWWITRSSNNSVLAAQFGAVNDVPVPADYTGDGKTDMAFFRPSTATWYVLRSEDFSFYGFQFGNSTDVTAPADFDGDGKADAAVFRNGVWFIVKSSDNLVRIESFGVARDKPVPADFDADGKADLAIYRPNGGTGGEWWVNRSTAGLFSASFGSSTDKTVVGDWTGDGKADCAFFRPSTSTWYVLRSEDFSFFGFPFGSAGDTLAPGDYDGDGKIDAAVFRQPGAQWFVNKSSGGVLSLSFGVAGDLAVPGSFVR